MPTSTFPKTFNPQRYRPAVWASPEPPAPRPLDAVVISDLHLGSDNCQAKALVSLLEGLLDPPRGQVRPTRLIINGDVFDSIDFRRLKKTHWKVLSLIRHLSDKLEVIWIAGNHDGSAEIVSHLLGVRVVEHYILSSGAKNFLVVHGHTFDDFIEDHPILTWFADCIYYVLQKIDRTHYVARLAKAKSKIFVRCAAKIRQGACDMAARLDCDAAICGHTHHPEATEATADSPIAYYNCGCWTENPACYLAIQDGQVALHRPSTLVDAPAQVAAV